MHEHDEGWFMRLRRYYAVHLADAMDHRARTLGVALAVVVVALASIPFLGSEFMPRLDEGAILSSRASSRRSRSPSR